MARPRTSEEGLAKRISFRMTESDYKTYLQKVEASGLSASEFFRKAVLTNKTTIAPARKPSPDLRRMLHLMNKTSNNVNQLAHRANADHLAGVLDRGGYERILYSLDTLASLMKAAVRNADPI